MLTFLIIILFLLVLTFFSGECCKLSIQAIISFALKKSFSHSDLVFNADIQERVSAQILYKDFEENVYILD